MSKYYFSLIVLLAPCCHAAAVRPSYLHCEDISFTFNVPSTIADVLPLPDLSTNDAITKYLLVLVQNLTTAPNVTRMREYALAGYLCEARSFWKKAVPLQVLAHGSSYTKEYWDRAAWGNMTIQEFMAAVCL